MNTNEQRIEADVIPDKMNIARMADTALLVLTTGLFPKTLLNQYKAREAKACIRAFITHGGAYYKNFAAFCQRILMVRYFMSRNPWFEIRFDILTWLKPEVKRGFVKTANAFEEMQGIRKLDPLFRLELKAFPEAVLELAEEGTPEIFDYWNDWFAERKAWGVREMFQKVSIALKQG